MVNVKPSLWIDVDRLRWLILILFDAWSFCPKRQQRCITNSYYSYLFIASTFEQCVCSNDTYKKNHPGYLQLRLRWELAESDLKVLYVSWQNTWGWGDASNAEVSQSSPLKILWMCLNMGITWDNTNMITSELKTFRPNNVYIFIYIYMIIMFRQTLIWS